MTSFKKLSMSEDLNALRIIYLFKNLDEKTNDLEFLKRETKMLEGLLSNLNGKQVAGLFVSSEKVSTGDEMINMVQSITVMTITTNITKTTTVGKVYNNVATKKSFRKENEIRCFLCGKMGHIKSHCPEYTIKRKVKLIREREVIDREESDDDISSIVMIDDVGKVLNGKRRLLIDIEIDGRKMKAEADSPVSFVSKANLDNKCIQPTKKRFCGLGENEVKIYRKASVALGLGCYTGQPVKLRPLTSEILEPIVLDKMKQYKSEGIWCEEKYPISTSPVICIKKKPDSIVC
uniref:CCHC-type domain-containing protein n=1 Tax=Strongyloides venezuelensis TaxID=75913 RepID=A0A0K0FDI0_STRVS